MWQPYVPVAKRKAQAKRKIAQLQKKGKKIEPVEITGKIAKKFWGKRWCEHLKTFADYANRLPRGRTYARNGSVCHLVIKPGAIDALVHGNALYKVKIAIEPLAQSQWKEIQSKCDGKIHSLLELLQGKLSDHVMEIVANHSGLFPKESEMKFECSCYDWAGMCKHIAAVLYGIGHRLDDQPDLLFWLRSVDPTELISTNITSTTETGNLLGDDALGSLFGIELEGEKPQAASACPTTGFELKQLRLQLKLSAKEFAKRLGLTSSTVYRWESTKGPIKLHQFSQDALKGLIDERNLQVPPE